MIFQKYYNATESGGGGEPIVQRMSMDEVNARFAEPPANDEPSDPVETPAEPTPAEAIPAPAQTPAAEQPAPVEVLPADATAPQTPDTEPAPAIDWRDSIKEVDPTDVLRQVGLHDDLIGLIQHYNTHGNLDAYYEAKVKNWDTVPPESLFREQLQAEYPTLSAEDLDLLYQDEMETRFKQAEHFTEKEQQLGRIKLQNEAAKIRDARKAEQAKFQVAPKDVTADQRAREAQQQQAQQAQEEALRQAAENIKNSPVIQKLQQERKVSVKAGDASLNFNVDAQAILDATLNVNKIFEGAVDEKGQPTTAWIERMAFFVNPDAFKKALIDQGKSLGAKAEIVEQVNPSSQQTKFSDPKPQTLFGAFGSGAAREVRGSDFFK